MSGQVAVIYLRRLICGLIQSLGVGGLSSRPFVWAEALSVSVLSGRLVGPIETLRFEFVTCLSRRDKGRKANKWKEIRTRYKYEHVGGALARR
jgi:hypothetical protein